MEPLSVLLPTYNEAQTIVDCLESVKWADEILIVDSFSTDQTLEIAHSYGARIIQHEYVNSAKQKNWAIPQCKYEWVLQIDSDERLEPSLQEEIQQVLASPPSGVVGFECRRKNHVFGKWLRSMDLYPGWRLSLFRRDVGRYQDREVDAVVLVPGKVARLQGHFLHYGFESISHRVRSLDRYTRYEADERVKRAIHCSWLDILGRPIVAFLYYFIWRQGFRDGFRGLFVTATKMDFLFWTYAKLWEKQARQTRK